METRKTANISECGRYRYELTRTWGTSREKDIWIMLNPSTADAYEDDPTIRRCMGFSKRWGYGGIVVLNLFAFRATSPKDLFRATDPIGPENDRVIANTIDQLRTTIMVAWGTNGNRDGRDRQFMESVIRSHPVHCLGVNKDRSPKHPLYAPYKARVSVNGLRDE